MTRDKNIVSELNELNSVLANVPAHTVYSVPEGYFGSLPAIVLGRIRAMQAENAGVEISQLSNLLSNLSREMPFTVPAGYFEGLAASVLSSIKNSARELSAEEETGSISPLLGSLKKQNPYSVPEGYFEQLRVHPVAATNQTGAKVVSLINRSWFRYAAVAVVSGLIAVTGLLYFNNKGTGKAPLAKFTRDVKKMDEQQKETLIDFIDAGMNGKETAKLNTDNKSKEIRDLLQDVPEEELKDFQEQTEDVQDVLMTN